MQVRDLSLWRKLGQKVMRLNERFCFLKIEGLKGKLCHILLAFRKTFELYSRKEFFFEFIYLREIFS